MQNEICNEICKNPIRLVIFTRPPDLGANPIPGTPVAQADQLFLQAHGQDKT